MGFKRPLTSVSDLAELMSGIVKLGICVHRSGGIDGNEVYFAECKGWEDSGWSLGLRSARGAVG